MGDFETQPTTHNNKHTNTYEKEYNYISIHREHLSCVLCYKRIC